MAVFQLVILAVWTVVVIRILSARATLPGRVVAGYLLLGGLLAFTALPLVDRLIGPYGGPQGGNPVYGSAYSTLYASWTRLLIIVGPVLAVTARRATRAALSVADSFLLAFAVGLGADLVELSFSLAQPGPHLKHLQWLPPLVYHGPPSFTDTIYVVPTVAYWAALVVLTVAIVQRFVRVPWTAAAAGTLVFLWAGAAQAAAIRAATPPFTKGVFHALRAHRDMPVVALGLLVVSSLAETAWVRSLSARPDDAGSAVAVRPANLATALRWWRTQQLGHAAALADREAAASRRAVGTAEARRAIRIRAEQLDLAEQAGPRLGERVRFWAGALWAPALFLFVLWGLPRLPTLDKDVWTARVFSSRLLSLPLSLPGTLLAVYLAGLLVRSVPARPSRAPDTAAFGMARRSVLAAGVGLFILVVAMVKVEQLYPLQGPLGYILGRQPADFTRNQLAIMYLLAGIAALRWIGESGPAWRQRPAVERRDLAVTNALALASGVVVTWTVLAINRSLIPWLHRRWGTSAYSHFKTNGLNFFAILGAVVGGIAALLVVVALRLVVTRARAFLLAQDRPARAGRMAGAANS